VIGSKDFELLWQKYAEPGGKKISRKNAKKFLKDFVVAIKVKYDPELAQELIRECDPTQSGWLDEDQFASLFFASTKVAEKHELYLTASLAERQRKINKEVDRDAGSGSTPSSPHRIEIRVEKVSQKKQRRKEKDVHESASDARSEISSPRGSEHEDSVNSNAKSDLTGSASHPLRPRGHECRTAVTKDLT